MTVAGDWLMAALNFAVMAFVAWFLLDAWEIPRAGLLAVGLGAANTVLAVRLRRRKRA